MNETNRIGTVLSDGYEVIANYRNIAILARQTSPDSPEPWAIWHLKTDGERYSGSYFADQESAERYYAYLCYDWADARTCTPQALTPEEDDGEPTEENIKKLLWKQMQLLAEESPDQNDTPQRSIAMLEISQELFPDLKRMKRNEGSLMNDDSYYEELIKGQRKATNMCELMIANTTKNAGMVLAYIGTSHPAFEIVFKYFVHQDYPDLKKRLLRPLQNKSEAVSSDDINTGTSTASKSEKNTLRKTNYIPDPHWSLGTPWDKRAEKEALRRNRHHL